MTRTRIQAKTLDGARYVRLAACGAVIAAAFVCARAARAAETAVNKSVGTTSSAVGAGSMLQFAFGLAVVLGLIVAAGWFMKRFHVGPSAAGTVKVIAGASVGQRERVVVVEVGDNWLVLGVAPGRVNALHTMPRGEIAAAPAPAGAAPQAAFAQWLKEKMEKRSGR
jgi:flagellar protein FliO/FliZ